MKKALILGLCTLFMMLVLVGCGDGYEYDAYDPTAADYEYDVLDYEPEDNEYVIDDDEVIEDEIDEPIVTEVAATPASTLSPTPQTPTATPRPNPTTPPAANNPPPANPPANNPPPTQNNPPSGGGSIDVEMDFVRENPYGGRDYGGGGSQTMCITCAMGASTCCLP